MNACLYMLVDIEGNGPILYCTTRLACGNTEDAMSATVILDEY